MRRNRIKEIIDENNRQQVAVFCQWVNDSVLEIETLNREAKRVMNAHWTHTDDQGKEYTCAHVGRGIFCVPKQSNSGQTPGKATTLRMPQEAGDSMNKHKSDTARIWTEQGREQINWMLQHQLHNDVVHEFVTVELPTALSYIEQLEWKLATLAAAAQSVADGFDSSAVSKPDVLLSDAQDVLFYLDYLEANVDGTVKRSDLQWLQDQLDEWN